MLRSALCAASARGDELTVTENTKASIEQEDDEFIQQPETFLIIHSLQLSCGSLTLLGDSLDFLVILIFVFVFKEPVNNSLIESLKLFN